MAKIRGNAAREKLFIVESIVSERKSKSVLIVKMLAIREIYLVDKYQFSRCPHLRYLLSGNVGSFRIG